jgi:ribosomal protein L37AE/L43A|tara:strand:- start:358 stop:936 length:579 start_codon:yes stop_codon:yes gene_type:complete
MAGYSKETERQNAVLKDLLSGKEHNKNYTQVGYEGKTENKGGETREGKMTSIMKDVRMPWFCPSCKKTMKKKLDTKFWRTKGHCFDCQIELENKMRINGEYEKYAKTLINENKKSYLRDLKQSIDEFEQTGGKAEFFNSVGVQEIELEKEKWEMGEEQFQGIIDEAREYITKLEEAIDEESKELDTTRGDST